MRSTPSYLLACGAAVLAGCSGGANPPGQPSGMPIRVADVRARGITGYLGVPLGKIVRIDGTAVDGDTLEWKAAKGRPFVRADAVDGEKLDAPVLIGLSDHPMADRPRKTPEHGERIRLVGYESGWYGGIVDGEIEYVGTYASTPYSFNTSFVVLKAD